MPSRPQGEDQRAWNAISAAEEFYNETKKASFNAASRSKYVLAGWLIREAYRRKHGLPPTPKSLTPAELAEAAAVVRLEAPGADALARKPRYGELVARP